MEQKHKAKLLFNPFEGKEVLIDEELSSLIQKIWNAGIRTTFCCQNENTWGEIFNIESPTAYICFQTDDDFSKFNTIAQRVEEIFPEEFKNDHFYDKLLYMGQFVFRSWKIKFLEKAFSI